MGLPEGYLLRRRDVVTLRATVMHDVDAGEDSVFLKIVGDWDTVAVDLCAVVKIVRRTWREDEDIIVTGGQNGDRAGIVVAVHEDQVWVKHPDQQALKTYFCNQLTLRPTPDPASEPPAEAPATTEKTDDDD